MRDKEDSNDCGQPRGVGPGPLWWMGQLMLTGAACFFVFFGITLLMAAYQLKDPFSFIMTFFAASLIILISAVMVMGFVMRAIRKIRGNHSIKSP
jgi:hypothetical protein